MSLSVRPLHPRFVGEVGGVDIGRPLDTATVAALWQAIDRYAVVVFRGQMLDDERQMDFARQFSELGNPAQPLKHVRCGLTLNLRDIRS